MKSFKPSGYNSVSPYIIVDGAQRLIDLLEKIFSCTVLRKYDTPDGRIMHAEVRIDDSVLMISDSTKEYPPNKSLLHVYVEDVDQLFARAIAHGCQSIQEPKRQEGDPDKRGMFEDFSGNVWAVGTQLPV
jgi:PhnB protein